MTQNKHFKALVRARMAKTGESYSISRSHLLGAIKPITPELVAEFKAHDRHTSSLAFVPGRGELLSGGFSGQARIWSTHDWSSTGELVGHIGSVNGFGLSGDGTRLVTASSDKSVRLWDLPARAEIATLGKHRKPVVAVDLSGDGDLAATGSYDGTVVIWSIADLSEMNRIKVGDRVSSVSFHPLKNWLATGSVSNEVLVLEPDGGEVARLATGGPVTAVGWTGDGEFLIGVGANIARLWSREDWEAVRTIEVATTWIAPFAVNNDSSLLAVGWEHHVGVWKVDDDQPAAVIDGLPKGVYNLDFSDDGRLLAMGAADGRVRVWRL
ncbi:MAG: WD40 repeat domain-containing protein [Acidimicrobiia bacterium]